MLEIKSKSLEENVARLFFSRVSFVFWVLFVIMVFFGKHLFGSLVTLWDTHDLGYVNFLYFSDSIGSGYIPFWNPFIQSGVFFPSLNNAGLFTFIQLPFALMAQVLNPVVVYEWLIQFYLLVAGIGAYFYFSIINVQRPVAIFAAVSFLMVLINFIGQVSFIVSLSSFFWFLYFFHFIELRKLNLSQTFMVAALLGTYIVSGYPWMNFVDIAVLFTYAVVLTYRSDDKFNARLKKMLAFITVVVCVYLLYIMPGVLNLRSEYSLFWGDLINYEPRLRSIGVQAPQLFFPNLNQAIINSIEPVLASAKLWVQGVGLVVFLVFVNSFLRGIKFDRLQFTWWALFVCFLVYSAAPSLHLLGVVNLIPFFNSNRWFGIGLFYVCISIIALTSYRLNFYFHKGYKSFHQIMFFLIAGNVTYFYMLHNPNNNWVSSAEVFIHKADARIKAPLYNGNERIQRKSKEYIYNNTEWLEKKVPTTHGYNNLGNPWYWSFKNSELFKNIVSITRDVRVIKKLDRIDYSSDNQFYDAYVRAVQETFPSFGVFKKDAPNFTPDKQLKVQGLSVQTTPNQTKVHFAVNNSALLSFNTPYDPSWEVYVNGKRATIIKVNAFFMGVVLHKAGEYDIQFKYRPYFTYLVFISGYLVLLVALLIGFRGMRRNKCI